jgi:hypothetical protein
MAHYYGWRLKPRLEAFRHETRLCGFGSESAKADFAAAGQSGVTLVAS